MNSIVVTYWSMFRICRATLYDPSWAVRHGLSLMLLIQILNRCIPAVLSIARCVNPYAYRFEEIIRRHSAVNVEYAEAIYCVSRERS